MATSRNFFPTLAAGLAVGVSLLCASRPAAAQLSPEETLKSMKPADGLEATLWAAEPDLMNPTNIDIDSRGRIWVTEACNYRGSKTRPEGDRILILEDTKGTGHADSAKVFYQDKSLFAPLGICVLGDKVYVAQSPNVLVFTIDPSGDKAAGPPQVLFTGFGGENHDHGVHAGVFGPDGRYYFNSGNEGGTGYIKHADGSPVVDSTGSEVGKGAQKYRGKAKEKGELGYTDGYAFRCDPDGKNFETLGFNFRNNYELTVDSFGTVWQSDNDDDGNQGVRINYVMEGGNFGYKGPKGSSWNRDMTLIPGQTKQEAHWHQRWPGIVPNLLHTGGGSPTGITVYEGDLLPEQYHGALLHCDAGPNVVRAYLTHPSSYVPTGLMPHASAGRSVKSGQPNPAGAPAPSETADDDKPGAGYKADVIEMLRADDKWFRPCDICVAPDGSVFVADWYDPGVGGHATGDLGGLTRDDLKTGKHADWHKLKGRIYRLAPPGFKPSPAAKPDLNSVPGQIAALKSPNFATRYLAWTKLHESGEPANKALEELYTGDKSPRIRARALWLLARSADGKKHVEEALKDKDPDIRITAVRAARLIKMDMVAVATELLAGESNTGVLRELCLAMNYEPTDRAIPVLVKLADKYDGKDRWYLEALGIGAIGKESELLSAWDKDRKNTDPEAAKKIAWRLKKEPPAGAEPPTSGPVKHAAAAPATDGRAAAGPFVRE